MNKETTFPSFWQAKHGFIGNEEGRQLSFKKGDTFLILEKHEGGWFTAERNLERGYVPSNYFIPVETGNTSEKKPAVKPLPNKPTIKRPVAQVPEDLLTPNKQQPIPFNKASSGPIQATNSPPARLKLPNRPASPMSRPGSASTLIKPPEVPRPKNPSENGQQIRGTSVMQRTNSPSANPPRITTGPLRPPPPQRRFQPKSPVAGDKPPANPFQSLRTSTEETNTEDNTTPSPSTLSPENSEDKQIKSVPVHPGIPSTTTPDTNQGVNVSTKTKPPLPSGNPSLFKPSSSAPPTIPLRVDLGETEPDKEEDPFNIELVKSENVFMKYGRKGKPQKRVVFVSDDLNKLQWKDPEKDKIEGSILMEEIVGTKKGHTTKKHIKTANLAIALSIICADETKTLELDAETPQLRNEWLVNFQLLLRHRASIRLG